MRYLIIYFNGRGNREKIVANYKEAKDFQKNCGDTQSTIWGEVE